MTKAIRTKRTPVPGVPKAALEPTATMQLGPRLKAARQHRSLSLRALGEQTGFSASFLSQVELGQASPSLASLERIAQSLGVALGDLVSEPTSANSPVVRRRAKDPVQSEWSNATVQSLLPAGADARLGAVLVGLEPGGRSGKTPLVPDGRQLAFCVRGKVTLKLGDEQFDLADGDSVFYETTRSALWFNHTKRRAEILLVTLRA